MIKLHHKEQDLQIRCVKWFRVTYSDFAMLMEHPKNEVASGNRTEGAIAKAEGVQAGVADLILHLPSGKFHSLAIEMKTKTGRQSPEQKLFQRYFEAAGNKYVVVRSFEEFQDEVIYYMNGVSYQVMLSLARLTEQINKERTEAARKELQKLLNK